MTLKEKLIQAIERSPDEILEQLMDMLQTLQPVHPNLDILSSRLHRKQGILVIETKGGSKLDSNFDVNAFIDEVREERIQAQIQSVK
jgi:hypothetical protein